jgi:RES domain-containing protein
MGAKLYGGRWNRKGTAVVYTSESRALCALEVLANADELAGDYVATPIEIPDDIAVTVIPISDLPPGWNASPPIDATRQIGTNWAVGLRAAVLSVPSAVIPQERNYIFNPAHPDFQRIRFFDPEPFYFDDRLGRAR